MLRRSGFNLLAEPLSPSATSRSSHLSPRSFPLTSPAFPSFLSWSSLLPPFISSPHFLLLTPTPPFSQLTDWVITSLHSGEHQQRSGLFKLGFNLFPPPRTQSSSSDPYVCFFLLSQRAWSQNNGKLFHSVWWYAEIGDRPVTTVYVIILQREFPFTF